MGTLVGSSGNPSAPTAGHDPDGSGAVAGVASINGAAGASALTAADATIVIGGIAPSATFAAKNIQAVANAAALATLASANLPDGSLVFVQTYKAYFCLVASTQAALANVRIAASGNAGHLWERVVESTDWWNQVTWTIDPTNSTGLASDENSGLNSAAPLLTFSEQARRLANAILRANVATTVLGSQQAGDNPTYTYSTQKQIVHTFTGTPTVLYSSVVTSFVPLTVGAATDDAQFGDTAVPGGSFTAAGVLAKGVVLKRTNGTVIYAWALKDLGTTTLRVSQPYNPAATTTQPAFAVNDTYQALQLPQILSMRIADTQPTNTKFTLFDWRNASGFDLPLSTDTVYFSTLANTFNRVIILANNPCFDTGTLSLTCPLQITIVAGAFKGTGAIRYSLLGGVFNLEGNVVCLQGARLLPSTGCQLNLKQLNFYDCTSECIKTDTGSRTHFTGAISGKGNVGKVIIASEATQVIFDVGPAGFFLPGITTDPTPYQAGTAVSASPILLQDDGNGIFQSQTAAPKPFVTGVALLKFSGTHLGGAAGVHDTFLADEGAMTTVVELTASPAYPMPARTVRNLRVNPRANTLAAGADVTLMKNGVATACTVNIPAGTTAIVTDLAHAIAFAANDTMDLRVETTAAGAGNALTLSCVVEVV
jgi:hypothetical protein